MLKLLFYFQLDLETNFVLETGLAEYILEATEIQKEIP